MSVISTFISLSESSMAVSNVEFKISQIQNQIMTLTQQAQQNLGDPQTMEQMHVQEQQLQQELRGLQVEYQILKQRVEDDNKMSKDSVTRSFKINA